MKNRGARCGVLVTLPGARPEGRMFKQQSPYMFAIACRRWVRWLAR